MAVTPPELMRRIYRKIEQGKGMTLTPEDLDLLAEMGALETMSTYTADYVKRQAEERQAALKTDRQAAMDAEWQRIHPRPHSDTEVERAARRAWEMCQPKSRRP